MPYKVRSFEDLVSAKLDPPDLVLAPWLPSQGLAMMAGPTGGGKTMVAMSCAIAIASGTEVLGWKAARPRRVLYVDGEMALGDMQERARNILAGLNLSPAHVADRLAFICSVDKGNEGLDLKRPDCRDRIEVVMKRMDTEVLWLDNLSCLLNSEEENDAGSWVEIQNWLLKLRRAGKTVVFLHHTGKAQHTEKQDYFNQRGTSKREDVLNTSMLIKPTKKDTAGTKHPLMIVFTKHRGFAGDTVNATLDVDSDHCSLTLDGLTAKQAESIAGAELS